MLMQVGTVQLCCSGNAGVLQQALSGILLSQPGSAPVRLSRLMLRR